VAVAIGRRPGQVLQEAVPLAHHHEQASPRGMVLLVGLKVFGEVIDPPGQQRDLDLRRTRVRLRPPILLNHLRLVCRFRLAHYVLRYRRAGVPAVS